MTLSGLPSTPPSQRRLQRFVGRVVLVEGKVVAEQDEAEVRGLQDGQQRRQCMNVLAMDLDELER